MSRRRTVRFWSTAALAAVVALLPATPAVHAQGADPFALPAAMADHAVLSCGELTLSGGAVVTSEGLRTGAAEGDSGHVGSNAGIVLDGGVEVYGDARPGPGFGVTFNGRPSTVTGSTAAAGAFDCQPVDLALLRADLEADNDNGALGLTDKGDPALGGDDGRALVLTGRDTLTLPAGDYLLSELRLAGNSRLQVAGPVRLLVTGEIDLKGGSHVNLDGNPFALRLWSVGSDVSLASQSAFHGFLYAPEAAVRLTGRARLTGALQGGRVDIAGGARVRRMIDDAPPALTVDQPAPGASVSVCDLPVSGVATDAEGAVTVTVNGALASLDQDGSFTGTADLWTDDPGLVVVEATDRAGNVTRVEVRVAIVAPEAVLESPTPGSLVGTRVVDLVGRSGTATALAVDGVPATIVGDGTFRLDGFDLGEDGLVNLDLVAENCGGTVTATAVLDLDTRAPEVSISSPLAGTLYGASPVTVSGTVSDAHLTGVTVGGVAAVIEGDGWTATGVALTEGANTLVATATDALGRVTQSAPVAVELDTTAPTVDILVPAAGLVVATPSITVSGEASDPNLAEVRLGDVVATLSGNTWSASGIALSEGENVLVAQATDQLGNTAASPAVTVVLDTLAPEIALDADALPALTAEPTVTATGTVSDPHLETVTVNGVVATVAGDTFAADVSLAEGANALVAEATDSLGHAASTPAATVVLDTLAPEVTITEPAAGAELSSRTVTVRGTVVEPHLEALTVFGVAATVAPDGTFEAVGVELPEGASEIVARATDTLGHAASSAPVPVLVDSLAPVVRLASPQDPLVPSSPVTVTGTASDPHLDAVTVAGVPAVLGTPTTDPETGETVTPFTAEGVALTEGYNELTATASDTFGHQATSEPVLYTLDTTAPEIAIISPEDGELVLGTEVVVSGTAVDPNLVGVTVSGVSATVADDGSWTVTVPVADGSTLLTAVATDRAGLSSEASVTVVLDTVPPALTVDTPPADACLAAGSPVELGGLFGDPNPSTGLGGSPAPVSVELRDAAGVVTTRAGELLADGRWRLAGVDPGVVDGTLSAVVTGVDLLGNTAQAVASWRVDATAPEVSLTLDGAPFPGSAPGAQPAPGAVPFRFGRPVAAGVRVTDGEGSAPPPAVLTLDGAPYVAGTPITTEGVHLLVATATDCAGHTATVHAVFRIDRTGPALVSTTPAAGARETAAVPTFAGVASEPLSAATVAGRPAAVDGTGFVLSPFDWSEGDNRVAVTLTDRAGNRSVHEVAFEVRTTPLEVEILEQGAPLADGRTFLRPAVPEVRPSDSRATVTATLDGAPFVSGTEVAAEGPHTLVATAQDDWGRTATAQVSFTVDLGEGPEIAITAPADGAVLADPVVTVSGTVAGEGVEVRVDGLAATVSGGTWSVDGVRLEPDAPTVVQAIATDAAGRTAAAEVVVTAVTGGPQVLILDPPSGVATPLDRIDVVGVVVDAERGSADGTVTVTAQPGGASVTVPVGPDGSFRAADVALSAGTNALTAEIVDAQGRPGTDTVTVDADFTPPTISLTGDGAPLADGATFGGPLVLAVEVADDTGTPPAPVVRLNGAVRPEAASPRTEIPITEAGGYVVSVVATDGAGNQTRAERSFVVDFGGCQMSDVQPPSGSAVAADRVSLVGRSGAAVSVAVRTGGGQEVAAQVADGTFLAGDVPLATVGDNVLVLVCTDAAGVETTAEHVIERLPAGDGPTVSIELPAEGTVTSADTVAVSGLVSAGQVTVNGLAATVTPDAGTAGDDPFTVADVPLVEGPNVLAARAVDGAGRTGRDRVTVTLDTQAPRVRITRPANNARVGAAGTAGAATVDVAGVVDLDTEPNLDRVTVGTSAGTVTATVDPASGAFLASGVPLPATPDGSVTLTVRAVDILGHEGTASVDVTFDPAGPAVVLDAPQDFLTLGENAPATVAVSGDAWAAEGARVSVNGIDLPPSELAWEDVGAGDGRLRARFVTAVVTPEADGPFAVLVRVTERDGDWAEDRRLLARDTTLPRVVEMVPADGAAGVAGDSLLLVLFSEPIDHASLAAADGLVLERSSSGQTVVGRRAVAGQAVAFVPAATLAPGESYVLGAGLGITDRAGNPLEAPAQAAFQVAEGSVGAAPVLDPLPAVLCADEIVVTGSAAPGATVEVRDGALVFRGNADAAGRFAVPVPAAGGGYHLLRVRAVEPATGAASAEASVAVRLDCTAPRVTEARFDRDLGTIRVVWSEPVDPATVTVGDESAAVRLSDADAPATSDGTGYRSATVSFVSPTVVELALPTSADAWWRDRPVRLQVGPPAADLEGNPMASVFQTVFFPGTGGTGGDQAGGFLYGEAYDDTTGRPLAGASAELVPAGGSGAVAAVAATTTDGRGRFLFTGDVDSGRYVLRLAAEGFVTVHRRLSLSPSRGLVPFDSRLTPRAEPAGSLEPAVGGRVTSGGTGELALEADPGALAGTDPHTVRLTPLSGQGLPDFLPLGWTPAAAVEVSVEAGGATIPQDAGWLVDGVRLELPVAPWVAALEADEELVAVAHQPASGRWAVLPAPEPLADGMFRVTLAGPGTVALVVADRSAATRPPQPTGEGELLAGVDRQALAAAGLAGTPELTAELSLDPPVVAPTGRSRARVMARSADGVTPWPSGLAVQAYLEERLILAGGGAQILEAPFSADLVLYHPRLSATEAAGAAEGVAGAVEFVVSPSPRAAQVLLDVGYEKIQLFPFPDEVEQEPVVGPPGGVVDDASGVELEIPEGALSVSVPVAVEPLTPAELEALASVAGFDTLAAVRVDLQGRTLGRPATLSLPAPAGILPADPADPRLVLAWLDGDPADGRGAHARLVARAVASGGRIEAAPVPAGTGSLPLAGLVDEGLYLVLQARQPIGFVTGFVRAGGGTPLAAARVTAASLGTAWVTAAGAPYAVPAPAGSGVVLTALHPTLDETGSATVPSLAPGQVVALDLTVTPVPPAVETFSPGSGSVDQPTGSEVTILFTEPLAPATVHAATLDVELADAAGRPSGLTVDGVVSLSADGHQVVWTPRRPLLPGRTFLVRFAGGVTDTAGTAYADGPFGWTFSTSDTFAPGGQVRPELFHVEVPVDGVARIYGDPGALPSVAPGATPWAVSPEIAGPVADPVRDTFDANPDGSFEGTVGRLAGVSAELDSRVWVKVFDSSGQLAAEFRTGPFETEDGKGFVAPAGEAVSFRSIEGLEVDVPAAAFDQATLVRVFQRQATAAAVGVDTPDGLRLGAYVELDFEGRARETLRVSVPAPAEVPADALVFVGEPVDLPWGRRLRIRSVAGVDPRAEGNYFSTRPELQPTDLQPVAAKSVQVAGRAVATKELPARFRINLLMEFSLRGSAGFYYEWGASWGMIGGGLLQPFGGGVAALYNKVADLWVYMPAPYDWSGGFLLPVLLDQPLTVVSRDTATGWTLAEESFDPLPSTSNGVVDVGFVGGDGQEAPPLLVDARPFRLVRFRAPADGETLALGLEMEAEGTASGAVTVRSTDGLRLAEGSRVALYDLSPALPTDPTVAARAPIAGPRRDVCDEDSPWSLAPLTPDAIGDGGGEEMLLVVGPGDLDPATAGLFQLQFDQPLVDLADRPVGEIARLIDLGPHDGCSATSSASSAAPRELPLTLFQSERGSRLTLSADSTLPAGHRFRLELEPSVLEAFGETAPAYWPTAPRTFEFGTRGLDGESVAGSPAGSPSLGDTDVARDLLKLGNLLLVASENGELLAMDASDTTDPEGVVPHAVMNSGSNQIRGLATDGHARVFYAGRSGPLWVVQWLRLEDAREAEAPCAGQPSWAAGLPCFDGQNGSVRIAYVLGYDSGFTASEWLLSGAMPTGTPMDMEVLTQDERGATLPLPEFTEAYGVGELSSLPRDPGGVYTFDLPLSSTLVRAGSEPSLPEGSGFDAGTPWRESACDTEEEYDRFQRVTVDNLTTGQSWSIDLENPWSVGPDPGAGDGTGVVTGVRARADDRLQVRYNLRTLGHLAVLGSGITVVDLNRGYRLPQTSQSLGGGQCGRRMGNYQGQFIDWPECAPDSVDLYGGLDTLPAVETLAATGCETGDCRGLGTIDVFAPLMRIGALHAVSSDTDPGNFQGEELAACISKVNGVGTVLRDMAVGRDVQWVDRGVYGRIDGTFTEPSSDVEPINLTGDLLALSLGKPGIFVFDVSQRSLVQGLVGPSLIGHLQAPGHAAFRLQMDEARGLLFAGGVDLDTGRPVIDVWDLSTVNGAPGAGVRPVPAATLHTAWSTNQIGIDAAGTGLVYTWDRERGAQVAAFDSPRFVFSGLYRGEDDATVDAPANVPAVERATREIAPLGVALRPTGQVPSEDDERQDERDATPAFKLRVALPGSLGPELTARVQSLRTLPAERHLGSQDVGAAVLPPGGPGWPEAETLVHLRRLGEGTGATEAGPLGVAYHLYESVETVLLVADPRARREYRRQDLAGDTGDEASECRRCDWPAYLPDPTGTSPELDEIEELLAGPYVRAFLSVDETGDASVAGDTRAAIAWFDTVAGNYPLPSGWVATTGSAAAVPSPVQVSLDEPALAPAVWSAGEAGVAQALAGGELLLSAADHAVAGRSLPFVFERGYRSGTLGYGPLGAAGWWSPLYARLRELPSGEVEYHDGRGQVWRFPPAADTAAGGIPEGFDDDSGGSYLVPEGLWARLQKLPGGLGWMLVSRQHGTARFDGQGRLVEIADRHHRGGTSGGERGSRLRLAYDAFGQLVSVVDDLGRRYRLEYHDDPRPEAVGGDGPRYGLLERLVDFVDREVEYRWDTERRLTEVRLPEVDNPVDDYATFSYTGSNRPTLRYEYDPSANVTASETAAGALLHGEFAALRLAAFHLPDFLGTDTTPPRARFAYDAATGRLTDVTFPGEGSEATWSFEAQDTGGTGVVPTAVTVVAPWGHRVEHTLADGRVTALAEELEVFGPSTGAGGGASQTVTTTFVYADDGRRLETRLPDGAVQSLCYADGEGGAGCAEAGGSTAATADRLARANVVGRLTVATTPAAQGSADYSEIATGTSYMEDNLPAAMTDGLGRSIDLPVPVAESSASLAFNAEGVSAEVRYDAYGRATRRTGGGDGGPVTSIDYGRDARGRAGAGLVSRVEQGAGDAVASWQTLEYDDAYNVSAVRSSVGELKRIVHDDWDRPVREESGLASEGPLAPVGAAAQCGGGAGAAVERAYDAAGHVVRERRLQDFVDSEGTVACRWVETRYTYNVREQLVRLEQSHLSDPATPGSVLVGTRTVLVADYDEHGRPVTETRPAVSHPNLVTRTRYDSAGRVAGTTTGAEGERRVGYDERSRVVYRTDGDAGVWRGRFDGWGRLYHQEQPTGAVTRTRFDRANQPIEEQTFSGDPTSDGSKLLARTRMEVTSFGAVSRVVEDLTEETGEARVTERDFDGSGRVVAVWSGPVADNGTLDRSQARRESQIQYEPSTGRVLVESAGGAFGEDPLVERRQEYGVGGGAGSAVPWPSATVTLESVPGQADLVETARTEILRRDVFGRPLSVASSTGESVEMLYDRGSGATLRTRTGSGAETAYSLDGRGLAVRVTRPNGRGHTAYSHDLTGLPLVEQTATADGASLWQTTTTYDSTGRPIARDYADGTRSEQSYNGDSTLSTVTTRDGVVLTYAYDAANRLQSITPSAATAGTTRLDAGDAYAWDPLSRPTLLERGSPGVGGMDPSLAIAYPSYDLASRPAGEVVGTREAISWTFDVFDRPVETVLPGGVGRTAGAFQGFTRSFDTLDRLTATGGLGATGLSATPLGADWSWGGASRLYAMTTRGALGTGVRYGYHGGAGPQVPGGAPAEASEWKLGRMSWGAAADAGATDAPTVSWGDFGFGWRGYEGAPSDGAKIGREVFGGVGSRNVLAGMGWSWSYDAGVRLSEAVPGVGSLSGQAPAAGETADRFSFSYGAGDELLERLRQATGEVDRFTTGDYGRIASRDGVAFSYDGVGRRLEDDRFVYRWDWRGQLVEVVVRETWPDGDVSPYAGHRLSYDYDAGGRLHRRLHEGVDSGDGTRPFIEERRYVWESDRMAVETGYGADGGVRWRHTYVPGPSGLDDAPQVVVEIFQPGSPLSGETRTYTYLTDELGTVVGLVAEDEGTDPNNPPVPVRYRYTPYGEAHVETGPELLRARFDGDVTAVETGSGTVEQVVSDESVAASGGLTLRWSVPLDGTTLSSGLVVERLVSGSGWQAVPAAVGGRASDGVGTGDDGTELRVVLADGWERGSSYRVRLAPELADELGRPFGQSETLQWSVPAAATESVGYERRWATEYETFEAARATVGGRMPGGQGRLFQGLWTDPVTGVSHARARWYDVRNGVFLTEDPMGALDSSNLYAFVGWKPSMATDPSGEVALIDNVVGGVASVGIGWGFSKICGWVAPTEEEKEDCRYSSADAGVDFALGFATSGLSNIKHVRNLGRVGRGVTRVGAEFLLDVGSEATRRKLKGDDDWTYGELAEGAALNFAVGETGSMVSRRLNVNHRRLLRNSPLDNAKKIAKVGKAAAHRRGLFDALAEQSTHGSGDRVVLGKWDADRSQGYIGEALANGGIYYDTADGVFDELGTELTWELNETFLRRQMDNRVRRFEFFAPETLDELLALSKKSDPMFRAREARYLMTSRREYSYKASVSVFIRTRRWHLGF